MRTKLEEIRSTDSELISIDPHENWATKALLKDVGFTSEDVNYPLLHDPAVTVSAMYGVAFQMRIHTEWSNRPATFIIDKQGVIRYAKKGESFGDRPSASDILSVAVLSEAIPFH